MSATSYKFDNQWESLVSGRRDCMRVCTKRFVMLNEECMKILHCDNITTLPILGMPLFSIEVIVHVTLHSSTPDGSVKSKWRWRKNEVWVHVKIP